MNDSQYWTSLWVLGLFILLCFFCLYLGTAALTSLYDRISTYEIWNSPFWLKLKIPLIVLAVIGFIERINYSSVNPYLNVLHNQPKSIKADHFKW